MKRTLTPKPKPEKTKKKRKGKYIGPRKCLEIQLDKVFSEYIKLRDDYHCVICGTDQQPQAGHLITRSCARLRWHKLNGHCQCASHNLQHEYRPEIYTSWFIGTYGVDEYNRLYELSQIPAFKWSEEELQTMLEALQSDLEELKGRTVYVEKRERY